MGGGRLGSFLRDSGLTIPMGTGTLFELFLQFSLFVFSFNQFNLITITFNHFSFSPRVVSPVSPCDGVQVSQSGGPGQFTPQQLPSSHR